MTEIAYVSIALGLIFGLVSAVVDHYEGTGKAGNFLLVGILFAGAGVAMLTTT